MAIRSGMVELINQFRLLVAEPGTAIFTDETIQTILDNNQSYIVNQPLLFSPYLSGGTTQYINASVPFKFLEGTPSGTALVRIVSSNGSVVSGYSYLGNGNFTFNDNQKGSAYHYYGRSYNFYKAVSDGWFNKAAYYAEAFDFQVEGRRFNKSQQYQHCLDMQQKFASMSDPIQINIDRGDYNGGFDYSQGFGLHAGSRIKSNGEYWNQV